MLGQWALGANSIGQPEEISSVSTPAYCIVWITEGEIVAAQVEVTMVVESNQ